MFSMYNHTSASVLIIWYQNFNEVEINLTKLIFAFVAVFDRSRKFQTFTLQSAKTNPRKIFVDV